jgi:hypothetical protein
LIVCTIQLTTIYIVINLYKNRGVNRPLTDIYRRF